MPKFMTRNEEIILLTILKLKENAYGVSIQQQIFQDMGDKWSFASIYQPKEIPILQRLISRKTWGES